MAGQIPPIDVAVEAEKLGYDGLFVADHPGMAGTLDTWTTLSWVAGQTTRIRLGTTVTPLPAYVPMRLAKQISTIDRLSNGRTIPGFGAGHGWIDFRNFHPQGVYPKALERVAQYVEGLKIILRLWTAPAEEEVHFEGKYYTLEDATLWPKPVQKPHPPIWQGGGGDYMLKLAAKYFNGWLGPTWGPLGISPEVYSEKVKKVLAYGKKYNRDMSKFTFVTMGSVTDSAEQIEKYRAAGVNYHVAGAPLVAGRPSISSPEEYIKALQKFAKEIVPSFT
jgi:alkanesulfonate monooxygenase SsuD/methylene tetrahydromethanopterin reductase-like flavin-dependent oxidoreductase (luciferase family)